MRVKVSREDTYVPKWRGNKKLPEAEQMVVHFKYMTAEQEERLSKYRPVLRGKEIDVEFKLNEVSIWTECVTKIDNFDDENGKALPPKAALDIPHGYSLITEVTAYIRRDIEEEEAKN